MTALFATLFLASTLNSATCLQNVRTDGYVDEFFGNLAEGLNGTTIPDGLEGLLKTAKVALKGNAYIAADALIKIAPILDDGQLEAIFKKYGYTLWSGSDLDRKIDIQKSYTVTTYPTPNELADALTTLLKSPLDNACTELDKAGNSSDALLTDGVKNVLGMFGVDLGDIGDLHLDKADLMAAKAVLKAVQGAVALLKGMDLENDYGTFVEVFGEIDAEAFFVEVPALFKGVRYQAQLNNSKTALKLALETVKDADALILARTDGKPHLIGIGEAGHLIPYGDDKILEVLRGNSDALIAALDGPSAIDVKGIFAALGETCPTWLARDTYRISLLPLFKGKYTKAISPAIEPDGTLWPETLPDPTFGGLLPDLTMPEALAIFESMQRDQLWTYAAYDAYQVNMPFKDGTANSHGGRRTIVVQVEGESELVFSPTMANASAQSSLTLMVDGVIAGAWSNDAPEKAAIRIAGEGVHELAWTFAVEGNALQETAGVHPVASYAYGAEDPGPAPKPGEAGIVCKVEKEYALKQEIRQIPVSVTGVDQAATFKVTGLPSGLKFKANTISGAPTKSGIFTATVQATLEDRTVLKKSVEFAVRDAALETFVRVGFDALRGKVTGAGAYNPLKKKTVTLKATASKGYVFAGWSLDGVLVSCAASYAFPTPADDVTYAAEFVTAAEDLKSIGAAVDELTFGAFDDGDAVTVETNVTAGVYFEWPVAADAISVSTVKVSGLPSGLKFTAKPVTKTTGSGKSKVVVTNVPANTIYGTPTTASKTDGKGVVTPSKVKVTVTTSGKSKREFTVYLAVEPLPAWAVGTFNGFAAVGGADGCGTLTVGANGKVSGKVETLDEKGKKVTAKFDSASFSSFDGNGLVANATYKVGKETRTSVVCVTGADFGAERTIGRAFSGKSQPIELAQWQNPWLRKDLADVMPTVQTKPKVTCPLDGDFEGVTLTLKAKGAVSAAGKLDGRSFSASAQLLAGEGFLGNPTNGVVVIRGVPVPLKLTAEGNVITGMQEVGELQAR